MNNLSVSDISDLIKRLSQAVGITGYQGDNYIQPVVTAELEPYVDRVEQDRLGSIIGIKQGSRPRAEGEPERKIMLAAHLDEIGAVVTKIDQGFLRLSRVGGLDARVLMGQEVTVHGRRNLNGIIGSVPPHFQSGERSRRIDLDELVVDIGLPAAQVAEAVQIGDLISFKQTPASLLNGAVTGKSMDNRASIAAMIACMSELTTLQHQWTVYAVATADEEWGSFLGATTQAYTLRPDVALVIDVTFADVDEIDVKLDKGPVIGLGPGNHAGLRRRLIDTCNALELSYQSEILPSGAGTDAYAIEISREGVPTVLISVPSRYMHTPVEVVQPRDVARIGRLMANLIAGLDESFVSSLIPVD